MKQAITAAALLIILFIFALHWRSTRGGSQQNRRQK
jgi:hypothetical protein